MNAYLYVACCYLLLQLRGSEVQIICRREGVTERWRGGVLSGRGGESRGERGRELLLSLFSAEPAGSSVHGNVLSLLEARMCMHPLLN